MPLIQRLFISPEDTQGNSSCASNFAGDPHGAYVDLLMDTDLVSRQPNLGLDLDSEVRHFSPRFVTGNEN